MERKVCLIFLIGMIIVIIIYFFLNHENVDYMSIGDSTSYGLSYNNIKSYSYSDYIKEEITNITNYNNDYSISNLTTRDLYYLIIENEKVGNNKTVKQEISTAELITLLIGLDEINNNQNINLYLYYLEQVISEIVKINHKEIFVFSLFSTNDKIKDINKCIENLTIKYGINYVDLEKLNNEEYYLDNSYLLNAEGQKEIKTIFMSNYIKSN